MKIFLNFDFRFLIGGGARRSPAHSARSLSAILLATSLSLPAFTQDATNLPPDAVAPDGAAEAMRYMVSNALAQFDDVTFTNTMASNAVEQADAAAGQPGESEDTNNVPAGEAQDRSLHHESRSQWLDRQRARQASAAASAQASDRGPAASDSQADNPPVRPGYSTFSLVNERNIFDPNRRGRRTTSQPRESTARYNSFSVVGTMSYDKGTFAFFDGTSSDYRKALKLSDTIAGYRITEITPDSVKLAAGTNQVELRVGMQMRREEGGPWTPSSQSQTYAASTEASNPAPASASSTESASDGNESDVIKRMMQRREQE